MMQMLQKEYESAKSDWIRNCNIVPDGGSECRWISCIRDLVNNIYNNNFFIKNKIGAFC